MLPGVCTARNVNLRQYTSKNKGLTCLSSTAEEKCHALRPPKQRTWCLPELLVWGGGVGIWFQILT